MSIEEYHALPMHPAWKNEYYGGMAHLTPRETAVAFLRLPIEARPAAPLPPGYLLRAPDPDTDHDALVDAFFQAFRETIEYCDWQDTAIDTASRDAIRTCFAGRRGTFLPHLSRVVTTGDGKIVAAALLVRPTSEPAAHLDLLFVRPEAHRTGLATAAVTDCVNALHAAGELLLTSAYHVGNDASVAWHVRFGFIEEPDLDLARARLRCAKHEIARQEHSIPNQRPTPVEQTNSADIPANLTEEAARLHDLVEELEEIEGRDGWEAVRPVFRRQINRRGASRRRA